MSSTLLTNLVEYWALENNTNGALSAYNLTATGASYNASGKVGGAYDFVAASSQKIGIGSNLGINGGSAFSMACWIRPASNPTSAQNIISLSTTTGNNFFAIWYDKDTWGGGTKSLVFTRNRDAVGTDQQVVNQTLTLSTWYHVALTYDGSTVKGYLNGTEIASFSSSGSGGSSDKGNLFNLGFYHIWYWDGRMDEAGVWNKKLSAAEVLEHYNGGAGITYPFTAANTAGFLPFFN